MLLSGVVLFRLDLSVQLDSAEVAVQRIMMIRFVPLQLSVFRRSLAYGSSARVVVPLAATEGTVATVSSSGGKKTIGG